MPEGDAKLAENQQFSSPAFSSIRSSVAPLMERPGFYVEPTALYAQRKGPIFGEKFKDRTPQVYGAGLMLGPEPEGVGVIIRGIEESSLPPNIKKYHDYYFTPHEQRRVHYGQVGDPERKIAAERTHGVLTKQVDTAGNLLNPQPHSLVEHNLTVMKEGSLYASAKHPLGQVPKPNLPNNVDPKTAMFGCKTFRGENGGEVVNPRKCALQVEWEGNQCKDLYRLSHSAYDPAEQKHRDYPCFDSEKMYGMPTPNDPLGGRTKKSLIWITDCLDNKGARVESERLVNYRDRFSHQLGKVRDPIAESMAVDPSCYIYGLQSKPDKFHVADLIGMRGPKEWLRNHWNRRNAVITEVRRQLKKQLWSSYEQFMNICLSRDKGNTGTLSTKELRDVFKTMNVPLEPEVLEQLLDLCDVGVCGGGSDACAIENPQQTDRINYHQLICILNWTDRNVGDAKTEACFKHNPDEINNILKLETKIDQSITDYRKSSTMYGANTDVPINTLRTFGVPSRRNDLPVPRLRKLDDRQNYGDEPGVFALVRPSIMSRYGISEREVFLPRNRTEIKTILAHIGVDMSEADFEVIWERAQSIQEHGGKQTAVQKSQSTPERETLSFEAFRSVLDQIMSQKISSGQLIL